MMLQRQTAFGLSQDSLRAPIFAFVTEHCENVRRDAQGMYQSLNAQAAAVCRTYSMCSAR